jgi:hypothetical protein
MEIKTNPRQISSHTSQRRFYLQAALSLLLCTTCLWPDPAAAQQQYSVRGGITYSLSKQQLDLYLPASTTGWRRPIRFLRRSMTRHVLWHGCAARQPYKASIRARSF